MKKRILALLLTVCMFASLIPTAFAAGGDSASSFTLGMPEIQISGVETKGTVVGFDTQEWYVIGDGSTGVNPVANNITLWHKQDDEPEEGLYNNYYGWSNIREYVFLTPNGSNEPVKESDPEDEDFPEFQEYEGIKLALFWTPNHNYGGEGKPMLIRPSLESGDKDRSRALYFAVDHNDTSEGKGFTNPIDYHGGSLQQMMEEIVSEKMSPKESALLTPRIVDLGEKGGKPTENQKFWPLSQAEYSIISKSKAAGYFEYYWLLAPSKSNDDYGDVRLPVVITDLNNIITIENSLYDAHDNGDGIGKQSGPVRPACNLNLENAWFATAASGDNGKRAGVISFTSFDALQSADSLLKDGDPIKFTMKDETQTLTVENAEIAVDAQGNGTVKFSAAATGENQYVSCFIMDEDDVLYYGKLADCSASGTGEIALNVPSELLDGTYSMYLFSEQDNGNNLTDFAGELIPITFAQVQNYTVSYDLNGGTGKDGVSYDPETVNHGATVTIKDTPSKSGYTFEGWNDGTTTHQPGAVLTVMRNVTLTAQWHKNSSGGGGTTYYSLRYDSNGGTEYKDERYSRNTVVKLDKVPTREGYTFTGWYADKELSSRITEVKMTANKTVYAGWEPTGVPEWLNGDDHFAYVIGYTDGTVRPLGNISRSETAAIFFRLLDADVREKNLSTSNTFTDVNEGMWHNTAISTTAKLGVVKGRSEEHFDPNAPITRAEFAAICARFDTSRRAGDSDFTDISGHWAEAEIERAASLGWILGHDDGTFRPENYITRAEAMTMINRVLNRLPEDKDDLLDGMNVWPDNQPGEWYYLAVQEATNSHDFTRKGGAVHERWTGLTADPDWTQYQ